MKSFKKNHVQIIGEGQETIVFSHGYGCDQTMWAKVLPYFRKSYRCVLFDHMGFGQSDLASFSEENYDSLAAYARDINDILFDLKSYRNTFVGHSVSSMIGLLAALERPENFSSLVMVAPSPCYLNVGSYKGGFEMSEIVGLLENLDSNFADWSLAMSKLIMGNSERPKLADDLRSSFCKVEPRVMKHMAEITFLSDLRDVLPKNNVPSLILQCSEDNLASFAIGSYLKEHLQKSELQVLKARGHCPHMSEPVETALTILEYLERRKSLKIPA